MFKVGDKVKLNYSDFEVERTSLHNRFNENTLFKIVKVFVKQRIFSYEIKPIDLKFQNELLWARYFPGELVLVENEDRELICRNKK